MLTFPTRINGDFRVKSSVIGSVGSILLAIIGFIIILYLAYFATKKIGRRMSIKGVSGRNIKIIDSISIGQNSAVMIIEAAEKTLLVGVTQNGINLISELDGEKIPSSEATDTPVGGMEFSKAFKKALEQRFGKKFTGNKEKKNDDSQGQQ